MKCKCCGREFDPAEAEEDFNFEFEDKYDGILYEDCYPEHDLCYSCAVDETYEGLSAGAKLLDLMGPGNAPWE